MAAVGYHRAPRSAGATWMRIVLALTLVLPAMATVAGPAAAYDAAAIRMLKNLASTSTSSEPYGTVLPVFSGNRYYYAAYTEVANDNVALTVTTSGTVLWSNDASSCTVSTSCTISPASATKTASVEITAPSGGAGPWDLTVTKGGAGKGTVTSSTGFTCRGTCPSASTLDIADATTVTLTAKPASGSSFVEWQNIDCDEAQTSLVCTFDIGADETDVIARFEPKQTISVLRLGLGAAATIVTSSPSGLACPPTCSATFGLGAEVVLTAALGSGSSVGAWIGVACDEGPSNTTTVCTFTVDGPAQVQITTSPPSATYYSLALTNRTAYTITSSTGGIDCGIVCQWAFPAGAITLSITMPETYRPVSSGLTWTGGTPSGGYITYTASVTFTTSDLSYTVRRARA